MSEEYKIRMKNVCKSFGSKKVLDGVTLDVKKGESLVIIGGSGTGKSVTIKCIQGLLTPESGSIEIDGREIVGMNEKELEKINAQTGMLFQGAALFDGLNIWENVAFGLIQGKKTSRAEAKKIALEKLRQVGLGEDVANLYPDELSGGMKKRVGLARAIAASPELIFFDEPTTGLDPQTRKTVWGVVEKLRKEKQMTVFLTTHYMEEASDADYVVILDGGQIVAEGTPLQLKNKYTGDFITLYNATEEQIASLQKPYEKLQDGVRIAVKDTKEATALIVKYPDVFVDYEIVKGKMDDVFLAVTGKKLQGEQA